MGYSPWGHKESDMTENTHICKTKDMGEVQMGDGQAGRLGARAPPCVSVGFCRGFLIKA